MQKKELLIITGEASGDLHAAALMKQLKKRQPNLCITGVGGKHMQNAGADLIMSIDALGIIGLSVSLKQWVGIAKTFWRIYRKLKDSPPDLVVLVDSPELNLRVARLAKKASVGVIYYISPQLWAWRENRVKKIKRYVDRMAVILPFESKFYADRGVQATYVGHPLVQQMHVNERDQRQMVSAYQLDKKYPIVTLLPGSREQEIKHMLPVMLDSVQKMHKIMPEVQWILAKAPTVSWDTLNDVLKSQKQNPIHVVEDLTYEAIALSDLAVATSGTVTLEVALLETPLIVLYRLPHYVWWIAKKLVRFQYVSLCNLIADQAICLELLQSQANAERLTQCIQALLENPKQREAMRLSLKAVKNKLGHQNASEEVANMVLKYL